MTDDKDNAWAGIRALEEALAAATEMMVQDYDSGLLKSPSQDHDGQPLEPKHLLFREAIDHLQHEFFGHWLDDRTEEERTLEAVERAISMAERDFEEDSELKLRNDPSLEREIAEEHDERMKAYHREDGYGADDPAKFDDFGPEDAGLGERLKRESRGQD